MCIKRNPKPEYNFEVSPLNNCEKFSPGCLKVPESINVFPWSTNQPFSNNVCLYSVFKVIAAVPLSTVLPMPLIFKSLSNANGAKTEDSFPIIPESVSLVAQFPLFFILSHLIIIFVGEGLTQITVKETSAKNETQTSQQNNYKEDKYETQRSSSGHDQADRATSGQRSHSPERERPDKSNSPRYKAEMANKEFIHK